jgi:hypothetical protein
MNRDLIIIVFVVPGRELYFDKEPEFKYERNKMDSLPFTLISFFTATRHYLSYLPTDTQHLTLLYFLSPTRYPTRSTLLLFYHNCNYHCNSSPRRVFVV